MVYGQPQIPQIPQTYDPMAQAHTWGQPSAYAQASGYTYLSQPPPPMGQPPPPMGQPPPPTMDQPAFHHAAPPLLEPQQWSGHPYAQWPQVHRIMQPVAHVRQGRGSLPFGLTSDSKSMAVRDAVGVPSSFRRG